MSETQDDSVDAVHEELNAFATDLAMQRENRWKRARRIAATVELLTYCEVAEHLRERGLTDLAAHYEAKAEDAEVRSSQKGHD